MAIEYTSTAQIAKEQGAKIAIYGNAKTGKTALCATCPKPFMIAIEPGLIVLKPANIIRMYGAGTPGICYDITTASIKTCADANLLCAEFASGKEWTKAFQTIFIDSLSQLAENELNYQITLTTNLQAAYGEMARVMLDCIRAFVELRGFNVVFTAKQAVSSASGLFSASFPGQVLDFNFPYEFDAILQTVVGDDSARYLRTSSDFRNFAGDRTGALNPSGELPYLYEIFRKISAA